MKAMSKFLQSKKGPMLVRTWLVLLLCVTNFLLAYGVALFYKLGGSIALMVIAGIISLVLVLCLAVPNLEPDSESEDE